MGDPYVFPNANILKNKFNLKDKDKLSEMERLYSTSRLAEIKEKPIDGNFDLDHLKSIHKYVFQDIYEWAGKIRTVDIAKSTMFCSLMHLDNYQKNVFDSLKKENYLVGTDIETFTKRAAYYLGEINMIHPFREGNGRTQREFIRELALNAGYDLNLDNPSISRERMIQASIQSANVNNDALEAIIRENIKPIQRVGHEVNTNMLPAKKKSMSQVIKDDINQLLHQLDKAKGITQEKSKENSKKGPSMTGL